MSMQEIVMLAIKASILLLVFGLGLHANWQDTTYLFRRPGLLTRSILSMNVIMPLFAATAAAILDLNSAVAVTIIALALAPVPPILPGKQEKAGGTTSYAIGLLVAAALFSIVLIPVGVGFMGYAFGREAHMSARAVAPIVLISILVPLLAGLTVNRLAPTFAVRIAKPVTRFASVLLVIAALPVLFTAWPTVMSMIGNGTLLVLALFTAVGLVVGHWLGGNDPNNRTVLALATAARHPAITLAIASANFEQPKEVLAVVLLHLIFAALVSVPYVIWRKRHHAAAELSARTHDPTQVRYLEGER